MALVTCKLCRKIFTAATAADRACPECRKRLEDVYLKVRDYLRDNPKEELNVEMLAEVLEVDIRDVQGLVDLGYLERDFAHGETSESAAEDSRQKLMKELEQARDQMKATAAAAAQHRPVSYGQTLYGDKARKR